MRISDLLLVEFDEEVKKTRAMLERVPADKAGFSPHPKSMPLARLAPHIAQLAGFGLTVLTEPSFDFSQRSYTPLPLESAAQLVRVFDEGAARYGRLSRRSKMRRGATSGGSRPRTGRSSPGRGSWRIARCS